MGKGGRAADGAPGPDSGEIYGSAASSDATQHPRALSCACATALPSRVLQQRAHIPPPEAGAPGIFALADQDRLRLVFTEAGFADPAIEEVVFGFRFAGMDDYWKYLNSAAGAIAMVLSRLDEDERQRIRGEIAERVDAFGGSGQIELPATSLVVLAS